MEKTISWKVRIFAVMGIILAVLGMLYGPHADVIGPWLNRKVDGFIRYHTDDVYRYGVDNEKYQRDEEGREREWYSQWWSTATKARSHMIASGMDPKLWRYLVIIDGDIALRGGFYVDGFWQDMDIVLWGKNCINRKGDLVVLEWADAPVVFIFPDAPDDKAKN
jgi:hypothetical protein